MASHRKCTNQGCEQTVVARVLRLDASSYDSDTSSFSNENSRELCKGHLTEERKSLTRYREVLWVLPIDATGKEDWDNRRFEHGSQT